MKIKVKIIIILSLLAVLTAVFIFFINNYVLREIVSDIIGNYNIELLESKLGSVDRIIYRRLERWESYAHSNSDLISTLETLNQQLDKDNKSTEYILNQDRLWQAVDKNELTPFMTSIIESKLSAGLRDRINFYNDKYGYDIFPEMFITNKYGANVAQTSKTSDYYQGDESWWQKTKELGLYVGDIEYDESLNRNALTLGIRIDDKDNNFLGIIKVVYNIQDIFTVIDELKDSTDKSINAYLLTADKKLIYSISDGFGKLQDYNNLFSSLNIDSPEGKDYKVIEIDGNLKFFMHSHSLGHEDFKGLGWSLIFSQDSGAIFSPLNKLIYYSFALIILLILSIIIIGILISKIIIKQIKKLNSDILIIQGGNLDYSVASESKDEIGDLSRAFNKMVSSLKQSWSEVDKKVEEQTKEIKNKAQALADQKIAILNILEDVQGEKIKLEQVTNKLSLATKSANIGVWEWDVIKNIITWDDQMYRIYGLKKGDFGVAYEAWQAGLHPDDKKPGDEAIQMALRGEKEFTPIFRVVWPSGEIRYVQAYAIVERDETGKPLKMIGVNFDITHEKEVDKAKTEFVSLASHQLRTPLSSINWYTEMLINGDAGPINEDQKKYLQEVYTGSQRMVDLVNSLLNVSRLDLGTFQIDPVLIDVPKLIKSLLEELKSQIITKKQVVKEIYVDGLHQFSADQNLLRMVLQNLLSNAVKYTPAGGGITTEVKIIDGKFMIKISDTGMGIPKNQQDKVFLKLFRADNAKQSETEGTGLGLYIIKSIVDQAGGSVWFESEENKGTTFYVSFPVTGMRKKEGTRQLDL